MLLEMPFDELNNCRGKDKIQVFREKVEKYRGDLGLDERERLVQQIHDNDFVPALLENIQYLGEIAGTTETFRYLKSKGVFVATGSGFPQVVTDAINEHIGWIRQGLVDFGTCGESAGGGRPKPNMINATLVASGHLPQMTNLSQKVNGFDYSVVLKVGDTEEDVREGLGAGARTIAVASGTQSREKLQAAKPLVVLGSVKEIPDYFERYGYFTPGYYERYGYFEV